MSAFYLVQRGNFVRDNATMLTGCDGAVSLHNMMDFRYEMGEIPKSFRRIMNDFEFYDIYATSIISCDGKRLLLFSRRDRYMSTIDAIGRFVARPWRLSRPCYLDSAVNGKKMWHQTNFWWCIDSPKKSFYPDWMAFFEEHEEAFKQAMYSDFWNWWMNFTEEEREEEYNKAI